MSIVEKYVISMCRDPAIDRKKGKRVEIDWKTIINSVVVSGADLMLWTNALTQSVIREAGGPIKFMALLRTQEMGFG